MISEKASKRLANLWHAPPQLGDSTVLEHWSENPLISVCICTYRRPRLLAALLMSLEKQRVNTGFEVIVVDNDPAGGAAIVIQEVQERHPRFLLRYEMELTKGISFARNKALTLARGQFLAWIDDDEIACDNWLSALCATQAQFGADAVFGPVLPIYPASSPRWARQSGLFDRPRHITGSTVAPEEARTGNAFVKASWFSVRQPVFDPKLANIGGEDFDFFSYIADREAYFVWCDEAVVSELAPLERQKILWVLERKLRGSTNYWQSRGRSWAGLARACGGMIAFVIFCVAGFVVLPFGLHRGVRLWSNAMAALGRVLAVSGLQWKGY